MEDVNDSFWVDRPVFVTGATGLLGSALTGELIARGASTVCLVRDWVADSRFVAGGLDRRATTVRGELQDFELLERVINEYEIDTVFHLGAQAIVGTAARGPRSTFESNVRGTWSLLEACRVCPKLVSRIVIASSDKAYGEHTELPYVESLPLLGSFPYDASKACAELVARSYYQTFATPLAITRCGNLFGGGDLNFNRLIPGTIRSVLRNERPVIRSDGTYLRDYFYVLDAVDAYLHLAERFTQPGVAGEAFNFGNEQPIAVLDLVQQILALLGRTDLEPVVLGEASSEIPRQYLDCGKARELLSWRPRRSVEEGLRETIAWYEGYVRPPQGG